MGELGLRGLRRAHDLAQIYHARPSALLGVVDPYAAWCVDEACAIVASHEAERTDDAKRSAEPGRIGVGQGGASISGSIPIIPRPTNAPRFEE